MLKKGLSIFIISGLILLSSSNAYATSAYGTHMPERYRWTCGLEGNFVIDRNLDNYVGGTSGNRYFFTASLGIFPWLSFDGKAGLGNVDWDRSDGSRDISYDTAFAGAYGLRCRRKEGS